MSDDRTFMLAALELARAAEAAGEVPVGAVVVIDNEIIGRAYNQPIELNDPSGHAEILALRDAAGHLGNYRLPGASLYVTLEPCAMCAGAMVHARIDTLVFACADPKTGAAGSVFNIVNSSALNHQLDVRSGVCEAEARDLLQGFFRAKR